MPNFFDRIHDFWNNTEKYVKTLRQVDDLAKELAPTDPSPDSTAELTDGDDEGERGDSEP